MKLFCFLLALSAAVKVDGLRVLGIAPFPSKSHFAIADGILKSLHEAGHEITTISLYPKKKQEKNWRDIPLTKVNKIMEKGN